MSLSARQIKVLRLLVDSGDKEIVCDGRHCMIDLENISRGTVNALLGHMAIKYADYTGVGCDIYIPTSSAEAILERPGLADDIVCAVIRGKPFYINDFGQIADASELAAPPHKPTER